MAPLRRVFVLGARVSFAPLSRQRLTQPCFRLTSTVAGPDSSAAAGLSGQELDRLSASVARLSGGAFFPAAGARETRALALLVGWASSTIKTVRKYAPLYTERGVGCVCLAPNVVRSWSTVLGDALTTATLGALDASLTGRSPPLPLVLHIFSGGPFVCLPKLVPAFAPGAPLNRKLAPACVLFDSGPTDFTVESGMAAAELTRAQGRHNAFTYHVVSSAGRLSEWLVGEKKRAELRRGLASPLLALPQLYLHSRADRVAPPEWVEEVVAGQREIGREVVTHCWKDSNHVRLFLDHPREYEARVEGMLQRCGLAS